MATATTKMATTTSKMATAGYKTMTYNPNMQLEMVDNLPPSAEDVEYRLQAQEQAHQDLVDTVKDLQKQVNQQAEKMTDSEDRSRRNNLRIRGIPNNVEISELLDYFQTMVKTVLPRATNMDLLVDRIHRLPKTNKAPVAAPKDTIVRLHFFHVKEEFLRTVRTPR
ncbi:Hypothetical predicted protein [Pelobates cultripes]|uniref:Uncharacterized protein n=1 Tax=Pelobates cultripes TaxID=61616 RepID=A0AAD1VT50_PELCU|nr:Hypothetical predicted protein [Pelobates cultripes]